MNTKTSRGLWAVIFLMALLCFPVSSRSDDDVPNPQTLPGPPPVRSWLNSSVKEIGGPFSLTDQDGRQVTDKDYDKYYKLTYFGYTTCPSECPMALAKLVKALSIMGKDAENIRILFITTDPKRDTPEVMKKYLGMYWSNQTVGLTGTPKETMDVENKFRIYAEEVNDPRFGHYTINHSTVIYFTGPDGRLLTVFNPADSVAIIVGKLKRSLKKPA